MQLFSYQSPFDRPNTKFCAEICIFVENMKKILSIAIVLFLSCAFSLQMHSRPSDARHGAQTDYLNSVKLTFLSWLTGSTKISYERAFPDLRQSGELCGSLICAGYDKFDNDPLGFTVRYGHKFFIWDNDGKSLMGFYLRPELMYSHYYYTGKADGARTLANMGTLMGTFGYQCVHNRFLADFWVGGGYAVGTPAETGYHHGFALMNLFGSESKNIAMSFSIRLGYCF